MTQNRAIAALGPSSPAAGGENLGAWDRERASPLLGARSEGGETGKPSPSVPAGSTSHPAECSPGQSAGSHLCSP